MTIKQVSDTRMQVRAKGDTRELGMGRSLATHGKWLCATSNIQSWNRTFS